MKLKSIGVIRTPFKDPQGMPINVLDGKSVKGEVHVRKRYAKGLKDLGGFERIWLIFLFHRSKPHKMMVPPFMDKTPRGLFSTRSPSRPNPIGISCVRLRKVEGNVLHVSELDILDGAPLLDIKPYQPSDCFPNIRLGWMDKVWKDRPASDGRFTRSKK
jgi:tRNA-Thr(GGU) m(6)t(6)A37 methyltransferase TsaA